MKREIKFLKTGVWLVHPSRSMAGLFKIIGVSTNRWHRQQFEIEEKNLVNTFFVGKDTIKDMRIATEEEIVYGQWKWTEVRDETD